MNVHEIELTARNGDEMPSALTAPEQCLFLSFRQLYRDFKAEKISREQAGREKQRIITEFNNFNKLRDAYMNDGVRWARAAKYLAEVEKSDCEPAKKMVRILDGRDIS